MIGIINNATINSPATVGSFKVQIVRRAQTTQMILGSGLIYSGTAPGSVLNTGNSFAWFSAGTSDLANTAVIKVTGQTGKAAANDVVLKILNIRKL